MRRLGISIYVDQAPLEDIKAYVQKAANYGFKRVFTCMISLNPEEMEAFKSMCLYASSLGMEVIADISPDVFKGLGLSLDDLSPFKDMGLAGIRLDMGFSGQEEALMSFNEQGLSIELNMSNGTQYTDNICSYQPNQEKIMGCHNFYPHRYTGLSRLHFIRCSKQFKDLGLRTAAFVSSPNAQWGPWPVSEGLCTLEEHREQAITTQAKDLWATDLIDDVIIGNMFATEEELKALGMLNPYLLSLEVELHPQVPSLEKKILLEEKHFNRGDVSEYMIRSTQSRVKYKGESFPLFNALPIERGHILIESDAYKRYAGELQIALKSMQNSGKTNVVGKVVDHEVFLLDQIKPWQSFQFSIKGDKS